MEANSLPTAEPKPPNLRWFHPTPARLLVILLVAEGILLLSQPWFPKVLTVVVAIPFSWLAVEMKRAREQRHLIGNITD
jgi:hypothetical protein